jgi:O-antigen ligase
MSFEAWGISGGPGYFGNAADLGVQMLILAPMASAFILGCRPYWGRYKRLFFYLFPLTAIMAVMATGERGTMLGLVTIGLVMVMVGRQKFRKLLVIGVVGFAIFHVMPDQYKARFETAGTDGTSQARLKYWKRGVEMYQDHLVFGIGFNNWQQYYATRYPGESLRSDHQEVAHSTPVTVLAEMGTLGFLFFYGIALKTLVTNVKTIKTLRNSADDRLWRYMAYGLNLGLCGFLIASCFITEHEFPFLFVQASLSAALYNVVHPKPVRGRRRVGRVAVAA